MSQFFTSGGRSTGASAAASVLPMNIQGWFPLGLTGLLFLQPMGFSKLLSTWMNVNLGVQHLSFYEDFVFLESFRFTAEVLIYPWPHTSIISPIISIPHQTVQFVKVINLRGHIMITKGPSFTRLHSWCYALFELVVQLLSHVRLFVTPGTAACQASLSFTISRSLLRFMSIELVMLTIVSSVALLSFCLQSFPQTYNDKYPLYHITQSIFTALNLYDLLIHASLHTNPWQPLVFLLFP